MPAKNFGYVRRQPVGETHELPPHQSTEPCAAFNSLWTDISRLNG
uniref:Uncharacterized protein n=1 Tax=Anguilla anguilla TaxID=7936 RepID=A0A0E9U6H4_ANGAN